MSHIQNQDLNFMDFDQDKDHTCVDDNNVRHKNYLTCKYFNLLVGATWSAFSKLQAASSHPTVL